MNSDNLSGRDADVGRMRRYMLSDRRGIYRAKEGVLSGSARRRLARIIRSRKAHSDGSGGRGQGICLLAPLRDTLAAGASPPKRRWNIDAGGGRRDRQTLEPAARHRRRIGGQT